MQSNDSKKKKKEKEEKQNQVLNCLLSQLFSRFSSCSFWTSQLSIAALYGAWLSCRGSAGELGAVTSVKDLQPLYPANLAFLEQVTLKIDLSRLLEYLQQPEPSWGHQQGRGWGAVPPAAEGAASLPEEVRWGGAVWGGEGLWAAGPAQHLGNQSPTSPLPISPPATGMLLKTSRRKARSTDTTSLYWLQILTTAGILGKGSKEKVLLLPLQATYNSMIEGRHFRVSRGLSACRSFGDLWISRSPLRIDYSNLAGIFLQRIHGEIRGREVWQ